MVSVFARNKRLVVAALLACVSTGISVAPAKAVPIARGLSALAMMLEETSPQKAEPIPTALSLSSYASPTTNTDLHKLTLLTIGADDAFDLSSQSGGANAATP